MENIKHATSRHQRAGTFQRRKGQLLLYSDCSDLGLYVHIPYILGRTNVDIATLKEVLSDVPFETVSMDFIFALPIQTFDDLKADIDAAFQSGANHVAIYPFIDFTFTSSTVKAMKLKRKCHLMI